MNESRYNSLIVGRYIAPEVFTSEEYDTKADVFSFALIVQEVSKNIYFFFSVWSFFVHVVDSFQCRNVLDDRRKDTLCGKGRQ